MRGLLSKLGIGLDRLAGGEVKKIKAKSFYVNPTASQNIKNVRKQQLKNRSHK
jgi:hypothetical protein